MKYLKLTFITLSIFAITTSFYGQTRIADQDSVSVMGTEKAEKEEVKKKVYVVKKQAKKEKKEAKKKAVDEKSKKNIAATSKDIATDKNQIKKLGAKMERSKAKGKLDPVEIDKVNKLNIKIAKNQEKLKKQEKNNTSF